MPKRVLKSNHYIRFSDCDPMGHLFNIKYLNYFLDAREDQVRDGHSLDMSILAKKHRWALLVGKHQIAYLQPALINESVVITSTIIDHSPGWIIVEFLMLGKENRIKAFMWSHFVSFDLKSQKTGPIPDEVMNLIQDSTTPKPAENFDERFLQLRRGAIGYIQ
ncbi:MAG: acyl-CoA thioesterase [Saprospirales bacterium]|nr:MAG: acyl-CoA thioesterase [Saprospirales bacterium]